MSVCHRLYCPNDYFYFHRLMRDAPETKVLFANVGGDDVRGPAFGAHALRVITGLDLCVNALQDIPVLEEITSHLAMQHARIPGLKAEYFQVIMVLSSLC